MENRLSQNNVINWFCVRCPSALNFSHVNFPPCKTAQPTGTKLSREDHLGDEIQICTNDIMRDFLNFLSTVMKYQNKTGFKI